MKGQGCEWVGKDIPVQICPPGTFPWWTLGSGGAAGAGIYLIVDNPTAQAFPAPKQLPGCFGIFAETFGESYGIPSVSVSTGLQLASYGTIPAWQWASGKGLAIRAAYNNYHVPVEEATEAAGYFRLAAGLEKANMYLQVASFTWSGLEGLSAEWDAAMSGGCTGL